MRYDSLSLKTPKNEEQEVPAESIVDDSDNGAFGIMDEFNGILGIEAEEKSSNDDNTYGLLSFDCMDWEEPPNDDHREEEEEEEEDSLFYSIKREITAVGLLDGDDDHNRVSLNLNLNYQEVLDAWSDRVVQMGEVAVIEEEKTRREASVMRYKEKRQTRLFSKKIRYQVRKLNADKRPRLKGRFVKRIC
ncbi:zinc finger protein CONSTANS-LIKE 6 isoform X3 [Manihot esculenta]|uniref:zinc finger protein CONSTANS-LIKE 6 isoform X3 n=1 Tax=Manihot esculenta TaxID=3983 RepID=UPI000B5D131F|nr:zinc finger protein CONSTANS-LIKE 6 isoform X3 [Manihot esculenta]